MPSNPLARLAPLALVFAAAACGADVGAVVRTGPAQVRQKGGDWVETAQGPVAFGNGAAIQAPADTTAKVRIGCGVDPVGAAATSAEPAPGIADIELSGGAVLVRRSGTYFDLAEGTFEVHAGPIRSRIVMFHQKLFLEVRESNKDGARFTAVVKGDRIDIAVTSGTVLLSAPGATPQATDFVTLEPGDSGSAEPGRKPDKAKKPK